MNKCTPPTLVLYAQNGCNDFVFNIPFSLFQATYQGQKLFDFAVCSDNGKAILSEFGAKIAELSICRYWTRRTSLSLVALWAMCQMPNSAKNCKPPTHRAKNHRAVLWHFCACFC
ncbi:hypothetical protein LP115_11165 [Moraxella bovis]|nr:hypothetical protein [Moraxella bovis]AWY19512.1 hypothetical protein DQF64_02655 [Moraxella bovis]UYZ77811.1 hypothetical protein LP115_11165 [Moraxella bovis]UYZ94902.1 hypothetical protein LP121_13765 [Moraxella bovis]UZA02651.1 hypothetical protein LP092_11930 [Moraxella bovis]UZA30617.1 hypothetical protein LP097_02935 [Moraxella bovis]